MTDPQSCSLDVWKPKQDKNGEWYITDGYFQLGSHEIKDELSAIKKAKQENWLRVEHLQMSLTICKNCHKRMKDHNFIELYACLMNFNIGAT